MKTIGVRELKAHLSRVLREVRAGETVLVTDRGQVVAELRAPDRGTLVESRSERLLARLASTGALRLAESPRAPYRVSPIRAADGTARALLDEAREEAGDESGGEAGDEGRDGARTGAQGARHDDR